MPLITITTSLAYFPSSRPADDTELQSLTAKLGEALPALIVDHAVRLHLDTDTPQVGVQVDYQAFHPRAVNVPDIGICLTFTETAPAETTQAKVREAFEDILMQYLHSQPGPTPDIAVDIFWGPGRGFLQIAGERNEW